jgi:hypothetical protein
VGERSAQCVSSDLCRAGGKDFNSELRGAIQRARRESRASPRKGRTAAGSRAARANGGQSGEQAGRQVGRQADVAPGRLVCADKNFPDMQGLLKLARTLEGPGGGARAGGVRVHIVVPSALGEREAEACWARVCARPAEHVGLTAGTDAAAAAERLALFDAAFAGPSMMHRTRVAALRGALETPSFFANPTDPNPNPTAAVQPGGDEGDTREPMRALAAELAARCLPGSTAGVSASALRAELEAAVLLDALNTHDDDAAPSSRGAPGAGGRGLRPSWACLQLEGARSLHVTLVPPPNSAALGGESAELCERARQDALDLLRARGAVGSQAAVRLDWLHIATPRSTAAAGAMPRRARGRRSGGDAGLGLAFWEVGAVDGLPAELHWAPQASIYHVTDAPSLGRGMQPAQAAALLCELRARRAATAPGAEASASKSAAWASSSSSSSASESAYQGRALTQLAEWDVEHVRIDPPLIVRATVELRYPQQSRLNQLAHARDQVTIPDDR